MKNRVIVCLLALTFTLLASAAKEPKMQPVYIFGFAASFTDSVACQTTVQRVDSAWLDNHGFLVDRTLYSLQLQMYMEQNEHMANAICSVFFSRSERKMRRLWEKMQRTYEASQAVIFHVTPEEKFHFRAEEYRPVVEVDAYVQETTQAPPPSSNKATKKESKKKKEKKK